MRTHILKTCVNQRSINLSTATVRTLPLVVNTWQFSFLKRMCWSCSMTYVFNVFSGKYVCWIILKIKFRAVSVISVPRITTIYVFIIAKARWQNHMPPSLFGHPVYICMRLAASCQVLSVFAAVAGESDATATGSVSRCNCSVLLRQSGGTWRHRSAVQCTTTSVHWRTALTVLTVAASAVAPPSAPLTALTTSIFCTGSTFSAANHVSLLGGLRLVHHWPRLFLYWPRLRPISCRQFHVTLWWKRVIHVWYA